MKHLIWPLTLLSSSIAPPSPLTPGSLGHVRYTLGNEALNEQAQGSEILSLTQSGAEFLAPLNSWEELDRLALLSHQATSLCGSIDYYPLGYTLAETVSHSPSYFSAEASFSSLESLISQVDNSKIDQTLTTLSSLPTRFHRNADGQNAGQTVMNLWTNELVTGNTGSWTLQSITHASTPQKSVVASLPGESSETIVLGAHLDSINSALGTDGAAPGADDDGSGIAILTEILRIIETNNLRFHKSIELHAYAAEEVGLVGSRALASDYRTAKKNIGGMLQFDMAYYSKTVDAGKLFFLEDYTSNDLTRNAIRLTKHYLGNVYTRGVLPRGSASDHKSWWEQGYPTLFPFENPTADNPYIHSADDTMDKFDDGIRMKRMVQLGVLFLAYQAGLKSLDADADAALEKIRTTVVPKDVYLSLSGSEGSYSLAVSGASGAHYLEYCRIDSAADFRCQGPRLKLTASDVVGDRQTFSGDTTFAKGEKYRIEVFDESDILLARRHISLE